MLQLYGDGSVPTPTKSDSAKTHTFPAGVPFIEVPTDQQREWENCLPLVTLRTLAGSDERQVNFNTIPGWADTWVRTKENFVIEKGMFVAQVHGVAMEPLIPAGSWCIFRPTKSSYHEGKTLLVRHSGIKDPVMGGQYTVRKWHSTPAPSGGFPRIHLRAVRPDIEPILLEPQKIEEVEVLAEWVKTLHEVH